MTVASSTPEDGSHRCPVCGAVNTLEPGLASDDAPCPHCGHLLWFTWENQGDVQVIRVSGSLLDAALVGRLFDALEPRQDQRLVFDFADAQYVSSQVLGKLIDLKRKARIAHAQVLLRNLHPDLREVFRITRMDQLFDLEQ